MKIRQFGSVGYMLCILFSFCQESQAQDIPVKKALDLVSKNSSFLNLSGEDITNSIVSNAYTDRVSHVQLIYLQQSYLGIPVYNCIQVIALQNGKAVSVKGSRVAKIAEKAGLTDSTPVVSAGEAVSAAARELKIKQPVQIAVLRTDSRNRQVEFAPSGISRENITSRLFWVPTADGKVHMAWQVKILPQNSNAFWLVLVNAGDQTILGKDDLTLSCDWSRPQYETRIPAAREVPRSNPYGRSAQVVNSSRYRVIPFPAESMNHPGGTPTLINSPWLNAGSSNPAVSLGWHNDGASDYASTRGNNVWAKEDHAGTDLNTGITATSSTALPDLDFDYAFNGTQQPDAGNNLNFAITQLFYWNNIMHDISYQYGFDEASGNFQNNNQGRGGAAGDFVFADAQDGSGTDNANFSTGADGSSPRMQMYLWTANPYKVLFINSPSALAGGVTSVEGAVSIANLLKDVGPVTGDVVLYNDNAATSHDACTTPSNAAALAGHIALIDRGNCNFTDKIKNAQNAGAIAVIMVNNVPGDTLLTMSGADNSIIIPAVMIFQSEGTAIKAALASSVTVNATLSVSDLKLDGDLDNGIMAHEYTHGISTRLTGGPATATCLTNKEEGGEGWSDYMALMVTTDWTTALATDGPKSRPLGTYVAGEDPSGGGIRTYPYSTDLSVNPWSYAQLTATGGEVHIIGEIWAATLWDMTWNIIQMDGINPDLYDADAPGGNSVALKLVLTGMKLQACQPGFIDGRDGILKADTLLYNGKYSCAIWQAFARRGMGINALQGSSNSTADQVADFSLPASAVIKKTVDKSVAAQNDLLTYTFTIRSQCATVSNFKIIDTLPSGITYLSGGTYDPLKRTVTFMVNSLSASEAQTFSFTAKTNTGGYFVPVNLLSEAITAPFVPVTLTASTNVPGVTWASSSIHATAPYSLKAMEPVAASEQILRSTISYSVTGNTRLSFWQNYNTEAFHDGGVVELSTDNGITWFDAGAYMSLNGYNSTIHTNSSLANERAFSGKSNGFIQTVVNLSSFENKSVMFRFRFVTDNTVSGTGWYIDDISVDKTPAIYNLAGLFNSTNQLQSLSDTVTAITSEILPLTWGDFTVQKEGSTALIKWATLLETNTDQFFVERSADGIQFKSIGVLPASGNTDGVTLYHFTDANPNTGPNYYRIRQTDKDGRYVYSEVRTVSFDLPEGALSLYPNPARDHIHIELTGNRKILQISLVNTVGQKVFGSVMKGEYTDLPTRTLSPGIYYLKISGTDISTVRKVVIER